MGGVSNAYSRIHTARSCVHGWVRTEKQRRRHVHGEPTGWVGTECVVVFIERAWTEQPMETRPGVSQNGGNRPPTVETGVLFIGRVWRTAKRDSTGYCSSPLSTSSNLHGLPSTSSSLHLRLFNHGLLFIQPPLCTTPPATVQPPLHGHPSTVYCSSIPPHHGVLFIHPSTV